MLVFGLTAGPFILNGQMTLGVLQRLHVVRRLPRHATVGENFPVTLCLSNRKRLFSSWMIVAEDLVQAPGEQLQPAVLFTHVPARSEREAIYEICPAHRGRYEFGPVRVLSRFPMGLMERSFELGQVEQLLGYPRIGRRKSGWWQAGGVGRRFGKIGSRWGVSSGWAWICGFPHDPGSMISSVSSWPSVLPPLPASSNCRRLRIPASIWWSAAGKHYRLRAWPEGGPL